MISLKKNIGKNNFNQLSLSVNANIERICIYFENHP